MVGYYEETFPSYKMSKKSNSRMTRIKVPNDTVLPFCKFCQKPLSEKEARLHIYVCEKVPQEIFSKSFQNTLGR